MGEVILNTVKEIIYPKACPICGMAAPVVDGVRADICRDCEDKVVAIGDMYCLKCGKELESEEEQYCYDCKRLTHVYTQGAAAFVYTDGIKQSIYRYKYKGRREYAGWYGKMLAKHCGSRIRLWRPDVIIPIPLHRHKLHERGYNQAKLMADALGENMGISVNEDYLIRNIRTAPMKNLTGEERIKNLKNAFIINRYDVKYNKVLLVDDIYTTGATVDACAKVLEEHGVKQVYCVSLCVGKGI